MDSGRVTETYLLPYYCVGSPRVRGGRGAGVLGEISLKSRGGIVDGGAAGGDCVTLSPFLSLSLSSLSNSLSLHAIDHNYLRDRLVARDQRIGHPWPSLSVTGMNSLFPQLIE